MWRSILLWLPSQVWHHFSDSLRTSLCMFDVRWGGAKWNIFANFWLFFLNSIFLWLLRSLWHHFSDSLRTSFPILRCRLTGMSIYGLGGGHTLPSDMECGSDFFDFFFDFFFNFFFFLAAKAALWIGLFSLLAC